MVRAPAASSTADLEEHADADFDDGSDEDDDRERLIGVMESVGWVQAKAARRLGLTPRQVGYALRKHEIEIQRF